MLDQLGLSLLRWFDSWAGEDDQAPNDNSAHIDWVRVVPFILLHLGCVAVLWVGISRVAVLACLLSYFIRMFAITAFYHRFFSHHAFDTSRAAQFVFAVLGNTASQRGPLWWAGHHRYHHRHSDTPRDLHSPVQSGFWQSHVGWIVSKQNFHTRKTLVKDLMRYPELVFLDRYDWLVPVLTASLVFGLGTWMAVAAPHYETTGPQMLVWGFVISTVVLFHATCAINSVAHIWGSSRYRNRDHSRNNLVLALITLGEGWHNNHHRFPGRAKQGIAWWEMDVTYYVLKLMNGIGLIWNLDDPCREKYVGAEQ
jgi:stearoyl-CoA desaturase (delta-9 desaturase)